MTGTLTNRVNYDANNVAIDAVTVFQTDRAEVRRRIKVELKEGQNDVEVNNLPTCLLADSIRVEGIGNATLFELIYHPPSPIDENKKEGLLLDLSEREGHIKSEHKILNRQAEILSDYARTLKAGESDSAALENFLDIYADRQRRIDQAIPKLSNDLFDVRAEISDRLKAFNAEEESVRKRKPRVTIVVFANGFGPVEFSLIYVVTHARWSPHYDLRASITNDAKNDSVISLHYRASISQKTGEDWNGVQVTLSTASPLLSTEVPRLSPYRIVPRTNISLGPPSDQFIPESDSEGRIMLPPPRDLVQYFEENGMRRREWRSSSCKREGSRSRSPSLTQQLSSASHDDNTTSANANSPEPLSLFRGAVSSTFTVPGLTTIPSDSDKEQQTHNVSIAVLSFEFAALEWITVPKVVQSVFLRCKVKNTSKYVILPGQANIYLDGSFVSKSSIPYVSQHESFSCSLGVDPAICVSYHPRTKKTRTTGGNIIGTKTRVTSFEQKITIKNTRLSPLPRLLVKDQIFVSHDAQVKVAVSEPKGLIGTQKGGKLTETITVRWSGRSESDGLISPEESSDEVDMESAQGMLEWICMLDPGAIVHLNLSWEISAPAGVEWSKQ